MLSSRYTSAQSPTSSVIQSAVSELMHRDFVFSCMLLWVLLFLVGM